MRSWEDIDPRLDAVLLPPKDTFYNVLCIIYINEDANDGNGSMEIEYVDAESILELNEEVHGNAKEFFGLLPDRFNGKWYYCDNTPERENDFNDWVEQWFNADFIGSGDDELKFLVDWATEWANGWAEK